MTFSAEQYSRHESVPGWNQKELKKKSAVIIGSDKIADFILADLAAIGCGSVKRLGFNNVLPYEKLNPDTEVIVEQRPGSLESLSHAEYFCDGADIVVEATTNVSSKRLAAKAAKSKGIPYISASAGKESFSIICNRHLSENQYSHSEIGAHGGLLNGIVAAACVIDEIRKYWMPRPNEKPRESMRFEGIREKEDLGIRVLQVGAGAIGTTTALALAMMKANLTIIDYDLVESSNLTRQFLFYDMIGYPKADALSQKLSRFSKVEARNEKITRGCDLRGFDVVLSCVDNHLARFALHEAAVKQGIPLINGGSSLFAGSTMMYVPKKTACLDCQSNYTLSNSLVEKKPEKRICLANFSHYMPFHAHSSDIL